MAVAQAEKIEKYGSLKMRSPAHSILPDWRSDYARKPSAQSVGAIHAHSNARPRSAARSTGAQPQSLKG
jgi:hypothetical protein